MNKSNVLESDIDNFLTEILKFASEVESHNDFLLCVLKFLCKRFNLDVGHYYSYVIERHYIEASNISYCQSEKKFRAFIKKISKITCHINEGLAGKSWFLKKAIILSQQPREFKTAYLKKFSKKIVCDAIAIPIFEKDKIHGVIELYSSDTIELSQSAKKTCEILSIYIGGILTLFKANRDNQLILNAVGEGVYGLDLNGNTSFVNPAACKILGYKSQELIGKPMHYTVHHSYPNGKSYPRNKCPMYDSFNNGLTHHVDDEVLWHKEGYAIPVRYTSTPIFENDVIQGAVVTFLDITKEKLAKDELERLAHYDNLTGLPNRLGFTKALEKAIVRCEKANRSLAVIFIDVDNFKKINDSLGHDFGDRLLQQLAGRFRYTIRSKDYLARLGGDEFAAIFEGFKRPQFAEKYARQIIEVLSGEIIIDRHIVQSTISMGIAIYPEAGNTVNHLLKKADIAMYLAKDSGKNQYRFYTDVLDKKVKRTQDIESYLIDALKNNELKLFYQPIFNIKSKKIKKFEALVRWDNKKLNNPSPAEFIPIAELTSIIDEIGYWTFEQSLTDFLSLQKIKAFSDTKLSINVSARQLIKKTFISEIKKIFIGNINPEKIIFELTETAVMTDIAYATKILTEVRALGFHIALDDFGTGYTSMLYLKTLPISYLKIDREFVKNLLIDSNDRSIIQAIIALSKSLGLICVAEGVEKLEQLEFLEKNKCDSFQGFLYGKPEPIEFYQDKYIK